MNEVLLGAVVVFGLVAFLLAYLEHKVKQIEREVSSLEEATDELVSILKQEDK